MKKLEKENNSIEENVSNEENNLGEKHEDRNFIFRPWITKNGQKIYAKSYGIKAFKIYLD